MGDFPIVSGGLQRVSVGFMRVSEGLHIGTGDLPIVTVGLQRVP